MEFSHFFCVLAAFALLIEQKHTMLSVKRGYALLYLATVVQMDSAIRRINHYPVDKKKQNQLRYPMDSDFSGGERFEQMGPHL